MIPADFYRQFEDRHRGPTALIEERLAVYLELIDPLLEHPEAFHALDLGCGRGEWLALLKRRGVPAQGVDLDPKMLAELLETDQAVIVGDALKFLGGVKAASLDLITAFHLAEHLPFDALLSLLIEAHRALKPGGVLIVETPNPENLFVSCHGFHLDPTHLKPLPPLLLDFAVEYAGFERTRVLRLHSLASEEPCAKVSLWDVIGGASQDYAILGQKGGCSKRSKALETWFKSDSGLTPHALAERLDQQQSQAKDQVHERLKSLTDELAQRPKLQSALAENRVLERNLIITETRLEERVNDLKEAHIQLASQKERMEALERTLNLLRLERDREKETLAQRADAYRSDALQLQTELKATRDQAFAWHEQIHQIQRSFSWRLTAPLRGIRVLLLSLLKLFKAFINLCLEGLILLLLLPFSPLLIAALIWVLKRPGPRDLWGKRIARYPRLRNRLRTLGAWLGLLVLETHAPPSAPPESQEEPLSKGEGVQQPLGQLSGQIFRILNDQRRS